MKIRLRQFALVAKDLAAAEKDIERALGVNMCFRDPGVGAFGLANALFPVGDKLLEVVSPTEDGTAAGRMLERRHGDGGYMVILQVDDLASMRERFAEYGVRVVHSATGDGVTGDHLHPKDIGGAIVSVDETTQWDEWGWAGPTWRDHIDTSVVSDLVGVSVQSSDPAAMAKRWAEVLGRDVTEGPGGPVIELDEGSLRFESAQDDRGDGVSAIAVRASDGRERSEHACGVRVDFVA